MRIGFDIDGVLSDFCTTYELLHVMERGANHFAPWKLEEGPVTWNWPRVYGYTPEETSAVWEKIKANGLITLNQPALPDMGRLADWWNDYNTCHDIYFVTARVGPHAKKMTEQWLEDHLLTYRLPTVLIASDKGAIAKALNLDVYVDDNWHNAHNTGTASPGTRVFLIDRAYNRPETSLRIPGDKYSIPENVHTDLGQPYQRVKSLADVLQTIR